MEKHSKIFAVSFLVSLAFIFVAEIALAQSSYTLIEPLPLSPGSVEEGNTSTFTGPQIFGVYVSRLFTFLLAFAAVAAVVMIVVWGVVYAGSAGNESWITSAREGIWAAVFGLVLALVSVLILRTINPDLVNLQITIPPLKNSSMQPGSPGCTPQILQFCINNGASNCVVTTDGRTVCTQ